MTGVDERLLEALEAAGYQSSDPTYMTGLGLSDLQREVSARGLAVVEVSPSEVSDRFERVMASCGLYRVTREAILREMKQEGLLLVPLEMPIATGCVSLDPDPSTPDMPPASYMAAMPDYPQIIHELINVIEAITLTKVGEAHFVQFTANGYYGARLYAWRFWEDRVEMPA